MDILKKVKAWKDNLTLDAIHCMFNGMALATYVVTIVQACQIDTMKGQIKSISRSLEIATNNDFKAYNQFSQCRAAIDALVEGLKTTHPGIEQYVNQAVSKAELLDLPYPD